jgi:predicted Zn finger-like uncharacterized protein
MSSPDLQTVVIACPNCGTRYQVPYATIGAAGREVQCAQCSTPWHAVAEAPPPPPAADDDRLFAAEEAVLDAAFEAEARAVAPPPAPVDEAAAAERRLAELKATLAPRPAPEGAADAAQQSRRRRAFDHRQRHMRRHLPRARVRRAARFAALLLLVATLVALLALRTELVRAFPALAAPYAAIGLPVNVIGLSFETPKLLSSFRDGKPLMMITARIRSVASRTVPVPPVQVSLVDAAGAVIYEWIVTPRVGEMEPGEVMEFSTEVSAPPAGAATVRLSFTTPRGPGAAALAGTL